MEGVWTDSRSGAAIKKSLDPRDQGRRPWGAQPGLVIAQQLLQALSGGQVRFFDSPALVGRTMFTDVRVVVESVIENAHGPASLMSKIILNFF